MKKYFFRIATLLLFASVALSSCSVGYRERHRRGREEIRVHDGGHDHHDEHRY